MDLKFKNPFALAGDPVFLADVRGTGGVRRAPELIFADGWFVVIWWATDGNALGSQGCAPVRRLALAGLEAAALLSLEERPALRPAMGPGHATMIFPPAAVGGPGAQWFKGARQVPASRCRATGNAAGAGSYRLPENNPGGTGAFLGGATARRAPGGLISWQAGSRTNFNNGGPGPDLQSTVPSLAPAFTVARFVMGDGEFPFADLGFAVRGRRPHLVTVRGRHGMAASAGDLFTLAPGSGAAVDARGSAGPFGSAAGSGLRTTLSVGEGELHGTNAFTVALNGGRAPLAFTPRKRSGARRVDSLYGSDWPGWRVERRLGPRRLIPVWTAAARAERSSINLAK